MKKSLSIGVVIGMLFGCSILRAQTPYTPPGQSDPVIANTFRARTNNSAVTIKNFRGTSTLGVLSTSGGAAFPYKVVAGVNTAAGLWLSNSGASPSEIYQAGGDENMHFLTDAKGSGEPGFVFQTRNTIQGQVANYISALNHVNILQWSIDNFGQFFGNFGQASPGAGMFLNGTLYSGAVAVGNVLATDSLLMSYTMPANSLIVSGRGVHCVARGYTVNNANAKSIRMFFGSTQVLSAALPTFSAAAWETEFTCHRFGLNGQDCYSVGNGSAVTAITRYIPGQTETAAIVVSMRGTGVANLDIINETLMCDAI